jgi:hypothetical protein
MKPWMPWTLLGLAIAAAAWPPLAIPAWVPSAIAVLVWSGRGRLVAGVACVIASLALVRFVIVAAAPGVVEAGENQVAKNAMYRLREIRLAQDALRRMGTIDDDHDGAGVAGDLFELTGAKALRGRVTPDPPPLHPKFRPSDDGVVCISEYCMIVYRPDDEERAERRFVAYAWPQHPHNDVGRSLEFGGGPRDVLRGQALFLDEHERIYECDNTPRYVGHTHVPAFDAALMTSSWDALPPEHGGQTTDGCTWKPWRGKHASASLVGDGLQ